MIKPKKHNIYIVKWFDIMSDNDWVDYNKVDKMITKNPPMINVGFFVKEVIIKKDYSIFIFTNGIDKGLKRYFDLTFIPEGAIIDLRKVDTKVDIKSLQKKIRDLERKLKEKDKEIEKRLNNIKIYA